MEWMDQGLDEDQGMAGIQGLSGIHLTERDSEPGPGSHSGWGPGG
jgi:hypothetical protein